MSAIFIAKAGSNPQAIGERRPEIPAGADPAYLLFGPHFGLHFAPHFGAETAPLSAPHLVDFLLALAVFTGAHFALHWLPLDGSFAAAAGRANEAAVNAATEKLRMDLFTMTLSGRMEKKLIK